MEENKRISDLFERARTEAPKTSFDEAKKHLLAASAVGSIGILAKWAALSAKFKFISMITAISILTMTSVMIFSNGDKKSANTLNNNRLIHSTKVSVEDDARDDSIEQASIEITSISKSGDQGTEKTVPYARFENYALMDVLGIRGMDIQDRSKQKQPTKSQFSLNPEQSGDSLAMKRFEISEKSTDKEIAAIQSQAIDAGLEFTFNTKIRRDKIKRLNLNMKKGNQKWMSKISGTDSFSFTFGWWEDSEGQFVKYICDDDLARICGECD